MANKTWLRLYTEITRDRKLRRLDHACRWIWITVLCMAKESPEPGRLLLSEGIPATIEDIADEAAATVEETEKALEKFKEQFMIHEEDGVIVITNWNKRQFESDSSTPRVRKHRQQKNETFQKRYRNGEETPPDTDTDTESDTDDLEEEVGPTASSIPANLSQIERQALKELKAVPGYPFDLEKDPELLRSLMIDFPTVDPVDEIKKWRAYKLDHPLTKKSNPRLQLRKWFENAVKWRKEEKQDGRTSQGTNSKHPGTDKSEFDKIDFSKFGYKGTGMSDMPGPRGDPAGPGQRGSPDLCLSTTEET